MAKAKTIEPKVADPAPAAAAEPTFVSFAIALLVVTGLGIGAGGLFGLQVLSRHEPEPAAETKPTSAPSKSRYAEHANLKPLPPIVTNLAGPEHAWVRLEASLVLDANEKDANGLAASIAEDFIAFLRTVSLSQVQGASGFQHLREDLSDRVRIRSGGKAHDLVIHTLIFE
jgi:flagellar FliL protein